MERADNAARLVDMGRRVIAIPSASRKPRADWPSVLCAAGAYQGFFDIYGDSRQRQVVDYLIRDLRNGSSVASCFAGARANARAARTAITNEVWEAVNDTHTAMRELGDDRLENGALSPLIDWIKSRCAFFDGALNATALRNDGFEFLRLGAAIERLDNTARMLDVKYFAAQRRAQDDHPFDHYEWSALLRAAGALRAFQGLYSCGAAAREIADFLVLNRQCPRSLGFCASEIRARIERLSFLYAARPRCFGLARQLDAVLRETTIDEIIHNGLHDFLTDLIKRNTELYTAVAEDFHFYPEPRPAPQRAPRVDAEAPLGQSQTQSQSIAASPNAHNNVHGEGGGSASPMSTAAR